MSDENLSLEEAVKLAATDTLFFGHYFFPKAFRQKSPDFHRTVVDKIEDLGHIRTAIKIFRGAAKTTLLRAIIAKRVGYALSQTILLVSETQGHSLESLRWVRRAIENNATYTTAFGLSKGEKWTDERIDIYNSVVGTTITIIGVGIFGQTRGLNVDDYRPDFILLDDILDEDNTKTPEMRKKVSERLDGAILKSLAPRSETPFSKAVMLQTPLHREDEIEKAMVDPFWDSMAISCFTPDGKSAWPDRWSTEELLMDKEAYRRKNQLSVWYKEQEVTVKADELSYFSVHWLNYYDIVPQGGVNLIGIDPTPPPKDTEQLTSNVDLDDATIVAIKIIGGKIYLLDYYTVKSPNPLEFITKIFEFHQRYRPLKTGMETVLFQRVLKAFTEDQMQRQRYYFAITSIEDKRKKSIRIRQAITDVASNGLLHVRRAHSAFIDQYTDYPDVNHDDILDALSIALSLMSPAEMNYIEGEYEVVDEEEDYEELAMLANQAP